MRDARWLFPNLVIEGHIVVIAAEPNGGKTTLFEFVAAQIAHDIAKEVIYVNADIASSDIRKSNDKAREGNYKLLVPDIKLGKSMDDVVKELIKSNETGINLKNKVYIFDTLKKMADVINKRDIKGLMKLLRGMTAKGSTIILLAHTNKYKDLDGNPVFEGTGDVRADVDELIYLLPLKNVDGSMTISTKPDKVRGDFRPITFNISSDRVVTQKDRVTDIKYEKSLIENQKITGLIKMAIILGLNYQSKIVDWVKKEGGFSRRITLDILQSFNPQMWTTSKGIGNNKIIYSLATTPPDNGISGTTQREVTSDAS
jgi:hypothetical protein